MSIGFYRMLLTVKVYEEVFVELVADDEQFGEYPGPPLPPETVGFRALVGASAEPDYPPSTCCGRVVRLGYSWSDLSSQMIRGQGRASVGSGDGGSGCDQGKTGGEG